MDESQGTPPPWQRPAIVPRARRRPDASSILSTLLALPVFLCSLVVMSLIGSWLLPQLPWLVPAMWILSGVVPFVPSIELVLARLQFGLRRPTADEQQRCSPLWRSVCQAAGVDGSRYDMLVQDSDSPNAFAAGGRIVAVTRPALMLPPRQLEAVLAHELGHHLSAHTVLSTLMWWYALPARGAAYLVGLTVRFVLFIGRIFAAFGSGLGAFVSLILALMILAGFAFLSFWLILIPLISPLLAWASRQGEFSADRTAAMLGYAPALAEVLYSWSTPDTHNRDHSSIREKMLATHPPHGDRIRRLEDFHQQRLRPKRA